MTLQEKITKLAAKQESPCVTISLNTHRTQPDNQKDGILLKNLVNEAERRIKEEYNKREVAPLLEKLKKIPQEINNCCSLDSLHIFLSNDVKEIIKTAWPVHEDRTDIGNSFNVRSLIKACNRHEEYLILLLSQGGSHLYEALNDRILKEIRNDDFPFEENPHYATDSEKKSDARLMDDLVKEYFNTVDKALVRVCRDTNLSCVAICTEDNYSRLMQVADVPAIYIGYAPADYNNTEPHQLAKQGWEIIKQQMLQERAQAIEEMKAAISESKVLTDLQEIYRAALDGRGEMLIVYEDFIQPVIMIDERNFEITNNLSLPHVVDDITGPIVWEVLSKGGRVYFTSQEQLKELGEIVLKVRY